MTTIRTILLATGIIFSSNLLHAQTALGGSINNDLAPVQTVPDSPVQITAEMQGLQAVAYSDLPLFGTYWEVMPGGCMAPLPAPVFDPSLPTYAITDNIFLVDATYGQIVVNPRQTAMMSATSATTAAVQAEATAVANLIDQVQSASANSLTVGPRMSAMDSGLSGPPGFGDTSTNSYSPDGITNGISVNYGTNLWIAQTAVASGYLTGIGSNTISGVYYVVQSVTNLLEGSNGWQYEGTILGSYLTNWTPLSVPQYNRQNLFIRLASQQSSDGSSIPDWWEALYGLYGPTNGVDSNAQDAAGDGYTIYQKYTLGVNPNVWLTPVAPSPVTVSYLAAALQADVQWQASSGSVVSYEVEKTYEVNGGNFNYVYFTNDYNVPASTLSLDNDVSGETSDSLFPFAAANDYYKVRALYSNGLYSSWSIKTPLKTSFLSASLIYGSGGQAYLALSGVPAGTAKIRLFYYDYDAVEYYGQPPINFSNDIPYTLFTNGLYALPDSLQPPAQDSYGPAVYGYDVFAQPVDTNGNATDFAWFFKGNGWDQPFYDGRVQLKQNLVFKLRAADVDKPFRFYYYDSAASDDYIYELSEPPTNYVESSLLHVTDILTDTNYANPYDYYCFHGSLIDSQYPFFENYLFYNFADVSANVDGNGLLNTGVGNNGYTELALSSTPSWSFQAPSGAWTSVPGLLDASHTSWICSLPLDNTNYSIYSDLNENDVTPNVNGTFTLASGAKNLYGLPFSTEKIAGHDSSQGVISYYLTSGNTSPQYSFDAGPVLYAGTAQPQLQTVAYNFWSPIPVLNSVLGRYVENWLPGSQYFSTTNQSQQFIVAVGSSVQVAGYAKMAVQVGGVNTGAYAYLGQYFDKAYATTNDVATSVSTGVLSPYGSFFATQPGDAALVTMPDVDTGARGTGIVHCVSLQVDKNHDGVMDTSLNGADITSQSSPMEFWMNSGNDQPNTTVQGGLDYDSPVPPAPPNYAPQTLSGGLAAFLYGHITCQRDLENFARLWICGMPALTNYQVTLGWANTNGAPAINLFNSVETNGGVGYLTSTNIAARQITATATGQWMQGVAFSGPAVGIATITPSSSYTFPASYFTTNSGNNYFLFEGAGIGSGQLVMTITDQNSNIVAQTGVWLDLHDIKDFYERVVITNNTSGAISNWSSAIETVQPAKVSYPNSDSNIVVYVHGAANDEFSWIDRSDTVFKRLYWAGYHGKLAGAHWPSPQKNAAAVLTYGGEWFNTSELIGYKSASAFKDYLNELHSRLPGYRLNLLPQSAGGIMTSEALKEGAPFDNLILLNNSVSASCYDVNAPTNANLLAAETTISATPDWQPWGYHGAYTNLTGNIVNYFNINDNFLTLWNNDQIYTKARNTIFTYDGANSYFYGVLITDPQESRAYVARSRSLAVGEQGPVTGQLNQGIIKSVVDLRLNFNYGSSGDEHSAFYSRAIQSIWPLYDQILESYQIPTIQH